MPHVVTQSCCADASCVFACPVNCIHPTPDEPDFGTASMLYIDPDSCVDCGACVGACPVGAITAASRLTPDQQPFELLNAAYFEQPAPRPLQAPVPTLVRRQSTAPVSVAVVGSGPAGMFTVEELLKHADVRVTVLERLTEPFGLARFGVAPDHPRTREVVRLFDRLLSDPRVTLVTGQEVDDAGLRDLQARHDAVVLATGASHDRLLGLPGEDLPGVHGARPLVAWYNGHPDHRDDAPDLSTERVVVVGQGNVALDVARILTRDPERLADTDISPAALAALRTSAVTEVVVVGRRGPVGAAFSVSELVGLAGLPDVDVVVDPDDLADAVPPTTEEQVRVELLRDLAARERRPGTRAVRLVFGAEPVEVRGDDRVRGLRLRSRGGDELLIETGLVVRSVGYAVPARPGTSVAPHGGLHHDAGRALSDAGLPNGLYVVGWTKRGPRGQLGTNRACARETVNSVVRDLNRSVVERSA